MSELQESQLLFVNCDTCKGFGYEVTPSRKHVRCRVCHDDPSMYAVLGEEVLNWGLPITAAGIRQRRMRDLLHNALNGILMLFGAAAFMGAVWTIIQAGGEVTAIFEERTWLTLAFWASVIVDFFLFYRLDRERASKKKFDYSTEAMEKLAKKNDLAHLARPTYEKIRKGGRGHRTEISEFFTREAHNAIEESLKLAKKLDHHVITPLHLMGALMDTNTVSMMLARLGLSKSTLFEKMGRAMAKEGLQAGDGLDLGLETNQMLFYAYEEARQYKRPYVDVMELFTAVIHQDSWVNEIFYDMEIEDETVRNVVEWVHIQRDLKRRYNEWRGKTRGKPKGIMDKAMTARPSPLLQSMSQDYTAMAAAGGFFPLIGRHDEMDQVLRILREGIGNVMLVGPSGVGKTTLFEGLAELMASEDVPKELQDKRLVILDPGALVAGAKGVGTVEGRILQVIKEINRAGNIILGIEDIHHLLNMKSTAGSEDAASVLMNALSQGFIKVIATTTTREYQKYISERETFIRRFQQVKVDEMTHDESILVLEAKAASIEFKYKVFFSYESIESCVDFTSRFIQDRYLPSKALDVMKETASFVQSTRGSNNIVSKEDVAHVISEKTNVQVTAITDDEADKLLNLEDIMHERVVGQDTAVTAVASALRRAREGLRDENRPIANFLFLGPTGVGKTETAKTIAEVYFGNEENMLRFDMSEYQSQSSLRKLIGGKDEQGYLTNAVRQNPFAIVLLDEIEKAHKDVLNIFLQVMDDGRITDGLGRTVDMSNTMIVATSNAGSQQIQNYIQAGYNVDQIEETLMNGELQQHFRPEFLNRFDNVVVFKPLNFEEIVEIARRLMARIAQRMLDDKGIVLEVQEQALIELAQMGYDPQFGARPLRRVLQDTVDDALAKLLLGGKIRRRDTVVLQPGGQMEVRKAERL